MVNQNSLRNWFYQIDSALVALSGGVDSSFVAYLAKIYLGQDKMIAVTSHSESLKQKDYDIAEQFCTQFDISLRVIHTQELKNPNYAANPINRCYFCKTTLYEELETLRTQLNFSHILNGHNLDDLSDHRPGRIAAQEKSVRSPLEECGLTKEDIRKLAKELSLPCWDKPASPCLSSRIPYGQSVTTTKLSQIEKAEDYVLSLGFPQVRVRHFGKRASVEVPFPEIDRLKNVAEDVEIELRLLGFDEIQIDSEGFKSGKLNLGGLK